MSDRFIPSHGGYQDLLSYKKSLIVYDVTVIFCRRFISNRDRTYDQMVQAARSGKQNIVEGSLASATSKKSEIFLTNVARSSLGELLEDYLDFLRINNHASWGKESKEALYVRKIGANIDGNCDQIREFAHTRTPEVVANIAICLVHQTNFLLDKQIRSLEKAFVNEGGLSEKMTKARREARRKNKEI